MALARTDKGKNPGTQTAGAPEGPVADGKMSIEVTILLTGAPSAVQTDYATLVTNVAALGSGVTITWRKR